MWQALVVFSAMFALDVAYAFYTRAAAKDGAWMASGSAAVIICLSGTAAIGYTHDPVMLAPAAIGAFLGTFVALRWL